MTNPDTIGVSQWKSIGQKYGYWDYFEKQIRINTIKQVLEITNKSDCPEKCNNGHLFVGYGGEDGTEENWEACPVCVKGSEYHPVIDKKDLESKLNKLIK